MKDDKDYGSIVPGKFADVVIVNGKPAEHVSELRKVERVVRGRSVGRCLDDGQGALQRLVVIARHLRDDQRRHVTTDLACTDADRRAHLTIVFPYVVETRS